MSIIVPDTHFRKFVGLDSEKEMVTREIRSLFRVKEDNEALEEPDAGDKFINGILTTFENADSYGDIIAEGALDDWMRENESIPMLTGHDTKELIGQWNNFEVDGLEFKSEGTIYYEETQRSKETYHLIKRNALDGVSIGFKSSEWAWMENDDGWITGIKFHKIELVEASIVLFPANTNARVVKQRQENYQREFHKTQYEKSFFSDSELGIIFDNALKNA